MARRIAKDQAAQLAAVDLSVRAHEPFAEVLHDGLITRRALGDGAVRQRVCIDSIRAQVLQHPANDGLTGADISGETDDVFPGPVAQC